MMMLIMITKRPANASQIPFILPSLTIQPKSSLSRLLTQRDPPCLQKTPPGLYHHDEFLSITVWRTLKGKIMLRLFNDSHQTVTIKFSQLRFHKPPSAVRINTFSVKRPHGDNQVSAEAVDLVTQQLQSSYSNFSKIVTISGLAVHQRALVFIENLFKKGKVHKIYSRSSLYIVGLVHLIFLDHQSIHSKN